jgi:hypothetical protein
MGGSEMREDFHPSNQELLLAADGELSSRRAGRVQAHLSSCWHCRTRMQEIETTIAEFTHAFEIADESIPPNDGPRALLKARLEEARNTSRVWSWPGFRSAITALAILLIAFGTFIGLELRMRQRAHADYAALARPRISLTPGAIRIVTRDEICSADTAERARVVPASLKQKVFEEYGMSQAKADLFEVDYLVTPELGGAEDIRNLWPQPYEATLWNAHVKDALEDRLHEMVCSGEIDLATAQHDIATDWISAYKKYFHTDRPF